MKPLMRGFAITAIAFTCLVAKAEDGPLRSLRGYNNPVRETVVRVRTASVVAANYALLRGDFPQLASRTEAEIDEWLLSHAGSMARTQVHNPLAHELNTEIQIDDNQLGNAYRPEGYGRGLVFEVGAESGGTAGLLDGKGFGAAAPRLGINGSGLLPLHEAVRELIWEDVAHRIFAAGSGRFSTVRCYAVFDWGFDLKASNGELVPAGAVLRQAHARETWNFNSNLPKDLALAAELELRGYGVTTAGLSESLRRQAQVSYDLINVQGKRLPGGGARIVDFGTFVRVPRGHEFSRAIAVRENTFFSPGILENNVGANREVGVLSGVLAPEQEGFVAHAANETAVPVESFGVRDGGRLIPEEDEVSRRALEWVREYRGRRKTGKAPAAQSEIRKTIEGLVSRASLPSHCEGLLR